MPRRHAASLLAVGMAVIFALSACQQTIPSTPGPPVDAASSSAPTQASPTRPAPPPADPTTGQASPPSTPSSSAPANAGAVPGGTLPFQLPSTAALRQSGKLVFAHYMTPFPISLDNKPAASDYYSVNYLQPSGENGKFAATGGFIRDRPLPRAPLTGDWQLEDMETDVRRAIAAGIDGFTVNIFGLSGSNWDAVQRLVKAAGQVDRGFKIVPMPDMTTLNVDSDTLAAGIATLAASSSVFRLADGRLVVSPFDAELRNASWWSAFLATMKSRYGITVAFVPTFLNWRANASAFAPISYGFANWGSRSPASNGETVLRNDAADVHKLGKIWMQPVSIQDERPVARIYDEANNTENLRATWRGALDGADWVQLATWNDYAENSHFAPSQNTGWTYLDISSYYLTWFKSGAEPKVVRDVVYVTHRSQPVDAVPSSQSALMTVRGDSSKPRDTVEVLTFLTAPATIQVQIGGQSHSYTAPAGASATLFPLAAGITSATASRSGTTIARLSSPYAVTTRPIVQNLEYYAVGSGRPNV